MSKKFSGTNAFTPKGRLLIFCHRQGYTSNREIEKLFDLGNGYFRSSDHGMNTGTLCKVIKVFPTLNLNWLVCGCGNIFSSDNLSFLTERFFQVDEIPPKARLEVAEAHVPYFEENDRPKMDYPEDSKMSVRIFNSFAAFVQPEKSLPPRWISLEKRLLSRKDDILVKITDESLEPHYPKGEYLVLSARQANFLVSLKEDEKVPLFILLENASPASGMVGHYNGNVDLFVLSALNEDKLNYPDIVFGLSQIEGIWSIVNTLRI